MPISPPVAASADVRHVHDDAQAIALSDDAPAEVAQPAVCRHDVVDECPAELKLAQPAGVEVV
jgi:hypothetical protein